MGKRINWFELKSNFIATWNPPHAIRGWSRGSQANGLIIDEALYTRALEIQASWRHEN